MLLWPGCQHRYCNDWLLQAVRRGEADDSQQWNEIQCPHENCHKSYNGLQCRILLSPSNFQIRRARQEEKRTPPELRFYCPFPTCSGFMRKPADEADCYRCCVACARPVCVSCNALWHKGLSCAEYRAELQSSRMDGDRKLLDLATSLRWQTCQKCQRVVSRDGGCSHIQCLEDSRNTRNPKNGFHFKPVWLSRNSEP